MENMGNMENKKSAVRLWLENYWYHHKYITIFGVFFLVVAIICLCQIKEVNSYDAYFMYSGPCHMTRIQAKDAESGFVCVVDDSNDDGTVNVSFRDLFIMSPKEISELEEGYEANTALIAQNLELFDQEIMAGEVTICMLSPFLFERVLEANGFMPIADFAKDAEVEYVGEYGVLLKSTAFGKQASFSVLPDDTILCVRRKSTMTSIFDRNSVNKEYERNLEIARKIFEMK